MDRASADLEDRIIGLPPSRLRLGVQGLAACDPASPSRTHSNNVPGPRGQTPRPSPRPTTFLSASPSLSFRGQSAA